jgi:hypothetical protein
MQLPVWSSENMNNEPVAWMVDGVLFNSLGAALNISFDIKKPCIPLYTHPAKTEDEGKVCVRCGAIAYDPVITQTAKTLTTEEIKEIAVQHIEKRLDGDRFGYFEFAKAVLKKAQEENNAKS